jgi:putative phosphoesterase
MTIVLAVSDTHLEKGLPPGLIELARNADIILHAGDFVSLDVYKSLSELGKLEAVYGNSDDPVLKRLLPQRRIVEVDDIRIGLVHSLSGPGSDRG